MRRIYKVIPFCFLLLSCSLFPNPTGTVAKYILTKPVTQTSSKKSAEKEIFVAQPTICVALQDHARIVYYPTPQKIEYLAGGEWAQKLDLMVWESLFEALKASHKFKSVLSETLPADGLVLKTHIAVFGVEQDGQQEKAHVVYEFLLFGPESKLISQKRIEQVVEIKDHKLDGIVFSLNTAHQKIIAEYIQTL